MSFNGATEKDLEHFYRDHLYLIAKELGEKAIKSQQVIGRNRLDILIQLKNGKSSILEFKKVALTPLAVAQLVRYWKIWGRKCPLAQKHYLVGLKPRDEKAFHAAIKKAPMKIIVKYLREDVPVVVAWSDLNRAYIPYSENSNLQPTELFL